MQHTCGNLSAKARKLFIVPKPLIKLRKAILIATIVKS